MFTKNNLPYLLTLTTLFKTFLTARQIKAITSLKTHSTIKEPELTQTKNYNKEKLLLSIVRLITTLLLDIYILNTQLIYKSFKYFSKSITGQSVFFISYSFFSELIFVPFDLFSIFVIEERYNYNLMSFRLFLSDFLKSTFLFGVINFIFAYVLIWCVQSFDYFYLYAFLFLIVLQVFLIVLYPTVILPFFNKFNELEEGELRSEIDKLILKINKYLSKKSKKELKDEIKKESKNEIKNESKKEIKNEKDQPEDNESKEENKEYTEEKEEFKNERNDKNEENEEDNEEDKEELKNELKNKNNDQNQEDNKNKEELKNEEDEQCFVKVKKILKMDGSKRSHHSNAYFIGLFKEKRIVLYDTLINQLSTKEIIAVLAHEFGHATNNHIFKHLFLIFLIQFLMLITYSFTINKNEIIIIDLIYFTYFLSFLNIIMNYLQNYLSRKYETEADEFGVRLGVGNDLRDGLIKIHKDNKAPPVTDKWYSVYVNSHPTLDERVSFINEMMKKED